MVRVLRAVLVGSIGENKAKAKISWMSSGGRVCIGPTVRELSIWECADDLVLVGDWVGGVMLWRAVAEDSARLRAERGGMERLSCGGALGAECMEGVVLRPGDSERARQRRALPSRFTHLPRPPTRSALSVGPLLRREDDLGLETTLLLSDSSLTDAAIEGPAWGSRTIVAVDVEPEAMTVPGRDQLDPYNPFNCVHCETHLRGSSREEM